MKTLNELRDLIDNGTEKQKLEASRELNNFLLAYNEEYNTLLDMEAAAETAHFKATHNEHGIDHAYRLELEALQTKIAARKSFLDMKLRAFQHSEIGIHAPDPKTIDQVKDLADKVSKMVLKDKAVAGVISALADIAKIVNGTMEKSAEA